MRTSGNLQTLIAVSNLWVTAGQGLWRFLWPPLVTLLLGFLLLTAAFSAPLHIVQDVGTDAPLLTGVYADESNQQLTYAYSQGDTVLSLPYFGRGSFAVSITAGAPAEQSTRRAVLRVAQDSYPLGSLQSVRTYHLTLHNSGAGDADLHIESEAAPVGTDARSLGILLDQLSVQTLQPMGVPSSVRNPVCAVTALLWLILVLFWRADRWRLPILLGGSLATCALYILGRGTWDVPVWWLVRMLGLFAVGLILIRFDGPTRLSVPWFWRVPLVCAAAILVISRRPDALFNAQFWAEDGVMWYYGAYTIGPLKALLLPHTGYYQTLPRLVAAVSLWVPLVWAPLVFNLGAIGIQILPVILLLSSRYARTIPQFEVRLLLALAYIAVPNREVHANLTNAQWHLALTVAMIILAQPSTRWAWRCFDVTAVALAAVSGPFCIFLAPMCVLRSYLERDRWLLVLGVMLSAGALIQLTAFVVPGSSPRLDDNVPLGASLPLFFRIVGGQVFVQTVLGPAAYSWLSVQPVWLGLLPVAVTIGGCGLVVYALWNGPWELRLFTLLAVGIVAGTLLTPMVTPTGPQWEVLAPGSGARYWRIPVLAFLLVLGYLVSRAPGRVVRWTAALLLVATAAGNSYQWRYEPWADLHWRDHAQAFAAAASGTRLSIPIHPDGWTLSLVKR